MICEYCQRREMWVLDCDLGVDCPSGKNKIGPHYHYECELCGWGCIEKYDDDPNQTVQQDSFAVYWRRRERLQ